MRVDINQLQAVGQQVVHAREAQGWTQTELADRAGFTDSTIRKVEQGVRVGPPTLKKVLDTVGIEPLAEAQERVGFPPDVRALLDVVGMYLVALPESSRPPVIFEITRFLLNRDGSAERPISGPQR